MLEQFDAASDHTDICWKRVVRQAVENDKLIDLLLRRDLRVSYRSCRTTR